LNGLKIKAKQNLINFLGSIQNPDHIYLLPELFAQSFNTPLPLDSIFSVNSLEQSFLDNYLVKSLNKLGLNRTSGQYCFDGNKLNV
jgi:hypothetical protein